MNSSAAFSLSALPAPRWHPFFRLLAAVVGVLLFSILIAGAIGAVFGVLAAIGGQSATQARQWLFQNLLLANLLVYPPALLWLWICRRFLDRRTFVSLGLRGTGFFGQFCGGAVCGVLAIALLFGILWIAGYLQIKGWSLAAQSGGASAAFLSLLGWATMMVCVGFFEEVAFRGYAFHNLNIWLGTRGANILQAAVFALIHLSNLAMQGRSTPDAMQASLLAMPNIFLFGLFAAICYLKTGSLWFPIAFHAAWNWAMGCVFSLPVSGLPVFHLFDVSVTGSIPLTGGAFGPEGSLLLTPILIALVFVASRAPDSPQALADLYSLRKIAFENLVEPETETAPALPEAADAPRENRFKTRMGKSGSELDEETRRTLQLLNATRRERENAVRENTAPSTPMPTREAMPLPTKAPVSVASQDSTPAVTLPAKNTPGAPAEPLTPPESAPLESAPPKTATPKTATPKTATPKTATPAPAESTPGASEAAPTSNLKPKKPAPRW